MEKHIGHEIKCLSTKIGRRFCSLESIIALNNLSGANGFIIHYLDKNKDNGPIYQKDIEKNFGITRSTASKILSLMETKGIIIRKTSPVDSRLKEIVLTEVALGYVGNVGKDLEGFDKALEKGFSEEELEVFLSFIDRVSRNLEEIK